MKDALKIGIVGCGSIAQSYHLPILSIIPNVKIAWLADVQPIENLAKAYGTEGIMISENKMDFPNCDGVLIATPVGHRQKYMEYFGEKKVPILAEKPFALNEKQHKQFLAHATLVSCNYIRNAFDSVQQMKQLIETNVLGELKSVNLAEGSIVGKTGKEKNHYQMHPSQSGGGILIERGCHSLSQLTHILGKNVSLKKANIHWMQDIDIDVSALLQAKTKKKKIPIHYELSLIRPLQSKIMFQFQNGTATIHPSNPEKPVAIFSSRGENGSLYLQPGKRFATTLNQAFFLQWNRFLQNIQEEKMKKSGEKINDG